MVVDIGTFADSNREPTKESTHMRSIALILLASAMAFTAIGPTHAAVVHPDKPSAMVRVDTSGGHGSGVYIGNGMVITAAHVPHDEKTVVLHLDDGSETLADIAFVNSKYDIAMVVPRDIKAMGDADTLRCVTPKRGDIVTAAGNPVSENDIYIPGPVVGNVRASGFWASVVLAAIPVNGGMSGGPVYDTNGDVVGITVGMMLGAAGKSDMGIVGVAYIVPGANVCALLGLSDGAAK